MAASVTVYEDCEKCWHDYYATPEAVPAEFVYGRHWRGHQVKPVGEPCPRCGDASPRGTWPDTGPEWFRVAAEGEGPGTVFHSPRWRLRP